MTAPKCRESACVGRVYANAFHFARFGNENFGNMNKNIYFSVVLKRKQAMFTGRLDNIASSSFNQFFYGISNKSDLLFILLGWLFTETHCVTESRRGVL